MSSKYTYFSITHLERNPKLPVIEMKYLKNRWRIRKSSSFLVLPLFLSILWPSLPKLVAFLNVTMNILFSQASDEGSFQLDILGCLLVLKGSLHLLSNLFLIASLQSFTPGRLNSYHLEEKLRWFTLSYTVWLTSGVLFLSCLNGSMPKWTLYAPVFFWKIAPVQLQGQEFPGKIFANQNLRVVLGSRSLKSLRWFSGENEFGCSYMARVLCGFHG